MTESGPYVTEAPPAAEPAEPEPKVQEGNFWEDVAEPVVLHYVGHMVWGVAGGLVALVHQVYGMTDTPLRPPPDDFRRPADQPGDQYIAVCGESHGLVFEGVTPEGLWAGPSQTSFAAADTDRSAHEHPQSAVVALCSASEGICGAVAPE